MRTSAIDEVHRLHQFFESWLSSSAEDPDGWNNFMATLAPSFEMVVPSGAVLPRDAVSAGLEMARGSVPGLRIEIHNAVNTWERDDIAVVRYEEWHVHETAGNKRVSTAMFQTDAAAPSGWHWLSVHETWTENG